MARIGLGRMAMLVVSSSMRLGESAGHGLETEPGRAPLVSSSEKGSMERRHTHRGLEELYSQTRHIFHLQRAPIRRREGFIEVILGEDKRAICRAGREGAQELDRLSRREKLNLSDSEDLEG